MSAGGAFTLIANDGKSDRMLMATALLNERIHAISCARQKKGYPDVTPSLYDIERSHVILVNKSYKPFVATAYEYNKVQPMSGSTTVIGATAGTTITFSIPQFGDFFHDMVVHVILDEYTLSGHQLTPPTQVSGSTTFPAHMWSLTGGRTGSGLGPGLVTQGLSGTRPVATATITGGLSSGGGGSGSTYYLVDAFGDAVTGAYTPLCRYAEYPGNKIFTDYYFNVNGNPLDEYNDITLCFLQKFTVNPGKEYGYNRLVGQENVLDGWSGPHVSTVQDDEGVGTAFIPATDTFRYKLNMVNGPQTPKTTQPALEIWNKLRFWFNDDVGLAIPSVSIPHGQRFISMKMCSRQDLVFPFTNLYLKTVDIAEPAGTGLVVGTGNAASFFADNVIGTGTTAGSWTVSFSPIDQTATLANITIYRIEMYINNIFVNPEIHDIYIKRIGFSLIRVYRYHTAHSNQATSDNQRLSQLKWPVEYLFVGLRPDYNVDSTNLEKWRDWHRMSKTVSATYDNYCRVEQPLEVTRIAVLGAGKTATGTNPVATSSFNWLALWPTVLTYGQVVHDSYTLEYPTIDTITVTAHGVRLYDAIEDRFFNAYQPFHYGGSNIVTPKDPGALMINFCLYPRSYQPSGHVNISRAREFYLEWTTSYVTSAFPATLFAVAIAINFLVVSDGTALLRYAT